MSSSTTNLSLTKPALDELADIAVINSNMDELDSKWDTTSPTTIAMSDSPDVGDSARVARANHRHGAPGFGTPVAVGTSNSEGNATTVARSNHVHQAATVYYNHGPESFDINAGTAEDVRVYVPSTPTAATLVLRGRALAAGLLPAHTHSVTSNVTATTNSTGGESLTSGNASVDHTHTATSGNASADHTHTATTSTDGEHNHSLLVENSGLGALADGGGSNTFSTSYSVANGDHSHTLTTGGHSATHSHSVTTGGHSATHSHSVSTANHSHTVSVTNNAVTSGSTGSGGFTASTRPAGVTVTIDGTDRTTALGGSFGSSGADWDEQSLNVLTYISSTGWHTISLGATTGGRLKAQVILTL